METGKIVKIIDPYNVIINLGYKNSITEGTLLEIYEIGPEIKDEESNYGRLDIIKATIKPKMISEKVSLCTNNEFYLKRIVKTPLQKLLNTINANETEEIEEIAPLKIAEISKDIVLNLKEAEKIKIGDLVRIKKS